VVTIDDKSHVQLEKRVSDLKQKDTRMSVIVHQEDALHDSSHPFLLIHLHVASDHT